MSSATYAEVMSRAAQHAAIAWGRLEGPFLIETEDARQAMHAFRHLLRALARHADDLVPERLRFSVRHSPKADPRLHLAARFANALMTTTSGMLPSPLAVAAEGGLSAHLMASATAVGAAADLLDTHKGRDGTGRTPESSGLDALSARLVALDVVAEMSIQMVNAQRPLMISAHEAGVSVHWLTTNLLPDLGAVRDAARELRSLVEAQVHSTDVTNAALANPGLRADEPLIALDNVMTRLRATAWRAATYPGQEVGIPMLIQFATVAVELHGTTALTRTRFTKAQLEEHKALIPAKTLLGRADCWRQVRERLLRLDSRSSFDPTLRDDVHIARTLLADLRRDQRTAPHPSIARSFGSPERPGVPGRPSAEPDQPEVMVALVRAARAFDEIAQWNLSTLQDLHSADQICLPNWILRGKTSRFLTGHDYGDHPDIGDGREFVPPPSEQVSELMDVYRAAGAGPSLTGPAMVGEPGPGLPDAPGL